MKKQQENTNRYELPAEEFETRDGSHYTETQALRPLETMTRGDIVWFILGHIILFPLALLILLFTAICLPLYLVWSKVRRPRDSDMEIHGEVTRILNDPKGNMHFYRGCKDESQPKISVVMPFYNRENWVDWAVGSVLRNDLPLDWDVEIIAVDNASTDGTVEKLKNHPVRIVHCAERGPGAARNAGIAAARAPIVAFTDSDCIVDSLWLAHLTEPLFNDPDVILCGGDILARQLDGYVAQFANEAGVLSNERFFAPGPYFSRFFATANMACRREDALKIGGFDNKLWMSEDADFSWRLLELGGKMVFRYDAVVYHQHRTGMVGLWRQSQDYGAASVAIFAKHRKDMDATWAISWKNIRDIAWSPFGLVWDQVAARNGYERKHELLYALWRLGFTIGSVRECIRRRVVFF